MASVAYVCATLVTLLATAFADGTSSAHMEVHRGGSTTGASGTRVQLGPLNATSVTNSTKGTYYLHGTDPEDASARNKTLAFAPHPFPSDEGNSTSRNSSSASGDRHHDKAPAIATTATPAAGKPGPAKKEKGHRKLLAELASPLRSSNVTRSPSPPRSPPNPPKPVRSPEPPRPVRSPEPPRPVRSPPNPPKPVRSPEPPKPVRSPEPPRPVRSPQPPNPVRSPELPRPVRSPAPPKPVRSPEPLKPVRSPQPPKPAPPAGR
jgi:hypothetical protein